MSRAYKIMTLVGNRIHSLADNRLSIPLLPGFVLIHKPGIWLGTTIEYVQQYYGSAIPEDPEEMPEGVFEIRCTFEYDPVDIIKGSESYSGINDPGSEFSVSKLRLVGVYNVTTKETLF